MKRKKQKVSTLTLMIHLFRNNKISPRCTNDIPRGVECLPAGKQRVCVVCVAYAADSPTCVQDTTCIDTIVGDLDIHCTWQTYLYSEMCCRLVWPFVSCLQPHQCVCGEYVRRRVGWGGGFIYQLSHIGENRLTVLMHRSMTDRAAILLTDLRNVTGFSNCDCHRFNRRF